MKTFYKKTSILDNSLHNHNTPINNSSIFKLYNPKPLDHNKKTMIVITDRNFAGRNDHVTGFVQYVVDELKVKYNIIYVGREESEHIKHVSNFYKFDQPSFGKLKTKMKRKAEFENPLDANEHNKNILFEEFNLAFSNLTVDGIFYMTTEYFFMPSVPYVKGPIGSKYRHMLNEFHDYIGSDIETINEINEIRNEFGKNYDNAISLLAYTMYYKNIFMNLPVFFHKQHKLQNVYTIVIDPAQNTDLWKFHNIPTKHLYLEEDTRGTREFIKFPICDMQHLLYETHKHNLNNYNLNDKSKEFFFAGTFFNNRGDRTKLWYKYLNDLNLKESDSCIFVPPSVNGIIQNKKAASGKLLNSFKNRLESEFNKIYNNIMSHPLYKGYLLPNDLINTIIPYKYSLILKCVSINDSLNFRPHLYSYLNILPFFDEEYDPTNIQIPKELRDKLLVKSHKDIENKIKYFNENPDERIELLSKLRNHFIPNAENFKISYKEEIHKKIYLI